MYSGHNSHFSASTLLPERQKSYPEPHGRLSTAYESYDPPELTASQSRASRKGVALTTCLTATLIVGSLIAMAVMLLSYLCAVHQCKISRHSVISTAPLGKVLTITQVTSHISPVSIPIIMGLFSYLLSVEWLGSSGSNGPNRPTPMQLGLLMSMCNGASIRSLFSSMKYAALRQSSDKAEKVTPAPILRQSIVILGSLLAVSYIVAGADAWLHASSTSVIILSNTPYSSSIFPKLGREINATLCQQVSSFNTSDALDHSIAASCGILNPGSGGSGNRLAEGIRVLSNSSSLHKVVFTDDQTAILAPQSLPSNITYEARTVGVRSQCTTITRQCIFEVADGSFLDYGPNAFLNIDCSKAGIKYVNASGPGASPLCALDGQGICTEGTNIPSNPFTAGEVVTSFATLNPGQPLDQFIGNTGWFVHGNNGGWNVVFCNVTALDVTYTFASSRFLLQNASPMSLADAQHVMAAGFDGQTTAVSQAVDGTGLDTSTTYEQAYSVELSRQMLARGAFLYEPTNVIRIQSENNTVGSNLRLAPLVLFIAALILFACQVLWITLRIIIAARSIKFVGLASLYLSNPLAVVQTLYGRTDPALTWDSDIAKRFGTETESDRLRVGPVHNEFGSVFVVTRG